jgi:hypothetical protein
VAVVVVIVVLEVRVRFTLARTTDGMCSARAALGVAAAALLASRNATRMHHSPCSAPVAGVVNRETRQTCSLPSHFLSTSRSASSDSRGQSESACTNLEGLLH